MRLQYLLFIAFVLGLAGRGTAQEVTDVLDWGGEITWHKHLIQQMHEQYHERDEEIQQAFKSKTMAQDYLQKVSQNYASIQGSFPPEDPLNAQVTGTIQRDGYHIEKVVYESFQNHHVTANLYVPEGEGKFPAALLFCGHERTAKATVSYQKTAILLAQNGFVVLVIDPISQGERFQLTDENGEPLTRGGTTEHTLLNASSNLVGTNIVNYEYWDNKRGLDYLMSRPEVDTTRIGVLGNSGGGTMTTYFLALNDTPKAAAVCSYVTKRERAIEVLGPQDGCQWVPYEGREHLEIADFLMMNGPVPTLILAGKYDFVEYVGTKRTFREMKRFYSTLEQPEKVKLFSWSDGHGISKPKREAAVEWFRRWFYQDSSKVEEGKLAVLSEEQLQVTATGQVNSSFKNEYTIQERNLDLAKKLEAQRKQFQSTHSRLEFKAKLKSLIGFQENTYALTTERVDMINWKGHRMESMILRKKGEVPLPAIVIRPSERVSSTKVQVWLSEQGKSAILDGQAGELKKAVEAGYTVILADVRGTGELKDPKEYNADKYHDSQYRNDQISLHIGKPVVGQRVQDIVTILEFIEINLLMEGKTIEMHASGYTASSALHAAVLNPQIDKLLLADTIRSYMEILTDPIRQNSYAYVVPNALKYYDLPDLVTLVNAQNVTYE